MTAPAPTAARYPTTTAGPRAPSWWGMLILIATEATLFGAMLSSYFYLRSGADSWPPAGIAKPELTLGIPGTLILISSSVTMTAAELAIRRGSSRGLAIGIALTVVLALIFLSIQLTEYSRSDFRMDTNAYGSLFFTITGLHGLHVIVGVAMLTVVFLRTVLGHFSRERHLAVQNVALYWHFVDVVWLFVFSSLYLSPRFL